MLDDLTSRLWHTADDVAAVVLLPVSYVQQQVGAVRVGPVSGLRANRRLIFHLLTDFIEMQLSYTIDNTGSNQRSDAAIPVTHHVRVLKNLHVKVLNQFMWRQRLENNSRHQTSQAMLSLCVRLPLSCSTFSTLIGPPHKVRVTQNLCHYGGVAPQRDHRQMELHPWGGVSGGDAESILREVVVWQRRGW